MEWRLESCRVLVRMAWWGSARSERARRTEDWREETEDRIEEREDWAWEREERVERRWEWRERTSDRMWLPRRRMPCWSFSAREAEEPAASVWEENREEEKEGERKVEKMGSEAKESRTEEEDENAVVCREGGEEEMVGVAAAAVVMVELGDLSLKVERRWRGEGDLCTEGEDIAVADLWWLW